MFEDFEVPSRRELSVAEKQEDRRRFAVVLNGFVLAYQVLHKFVTPLSVLWTAKTDQSSIQHLDWWWLYHLVLFLFLRRKEAFDFKLIAFVYFGFGGVATQLFFAMDQQRGWFVVSIWMTTLATLGVLFYILFIFPQIQRSLLRTVFLWSAVVFGGVVQFFLTQSGFYHKVHDALSQTQEKSQQDHQAWERIDEQPSCGVSQFVLPLKQEVFLNNGMSANTLQIKPCGFEAPLIYFDPKKTFLISNASGVYLNVKFYRLTARQNWVAYQNKPLRSHQVFDLSPTDLGDSLILVTSDSDIQKGISLLLPGDAQSALQTFSQFLKHSDFDKTQEWTVSREGVFPFSLHFQKK